MPGMTPRVSSGWPKDAVSLAMMMSHIIASSQPPPRAYPLMAPTRGLRMRRSSSQRSNMRPAYTWEWLLVDISLMSAPQANAFSPAPVRTSARTSGEASNACAAATTPSMTSRLRAFSALRRLMVITPTPSVTLVSTVEGSEASEAKALGARAAVTGSKPGGPGCAPQRPAHLATEAEAAASSGNRSRSADAAVRLVGRASWHSDTRSIEGYRLHGVATSR
mmetsp:Transcript_27124/g.69705  ORF Transcript_27124/g.69705 Transcript_27124/m.69705 type:complete len:221 (+) Transcript_27124:387-1049(+)